MVLALGVPEELRNLLTPGDTPEEEFLHFEKLEVVGYTLNFYRIYFHIWSLSKDETNLLLQGQRITSILLTSLLKMWKILL